MAEQIPLNRLGRGTPSTTKFLRGDGAWETPANGGAVVIGSATLTLTDHVQRFTVTDGSVTAASTILVGVARYTTDEADYGAVFVANVVARAAGSFDVVVANVVDARDGAGYDTPPASIVLHYIVA